MEDTEVQVGGMEAKVGPLIIYNFRWIAQLSCLTLQENVSYFHK